MKPKINENDLSKLSREELELGLNPSSFSFIKSIFASTFTIF